MKGFIQVTEHYIKVEALISLSIIGCVDKRDDGRASIKLLTEKTPNYPSFINPFVCDETFEEVFAKIKKAK